MAFGKTAIGRSLLAFAMLGACLLSAPIRAQADPAPGFVDAGDLDPALFPLLDALLHVRDAPGPGALRSTTTDGSGVMLHFASLVLLLPAGRPMMRPCRRSLGRCSIVRVTRRWYQTAPSPMDCSPQPRRPMPGMCCTTLPEGTLPPARSAPETRMIGGYDVPLPFAPLVTADPPARPMSHEPETIARQATDLAAPGCRCASRSGSRSRAASVSCSPSRGAYSSGIR